VLLQNLGTGTKTWIRDGEPSSSGSRRSLKLERKAEVAGEPRTENLAIDLLIRLLVSWNIGCFEF
jgi:hypothetical protein